MLADRLEAFLIWEAQSAMEVQDRQLAKHFSFCFWRIAEGGVGFGSYGFPSFPRTTPLGNFFAVEPVAASELAEAVGRSRVSSAILVVS